MARHHPFRKRVNYFCENFLHYNAVDLLEIGHVYLKVVYNIEMLNFLPVIMDKSGILQKNYCEKEESTNACS